MGTFSQSVMRFGGVTLLGWSGVGWGPSVASIPEGAGDSGDPSGGGGQS